MRISIPLSLLTALCFAACEKPPPSVYVERSPVSGGTFESLINQGTRANRADAPGEAEQAFRDALQLDKKGQDKDGSNGVRTTMTLALQLSNEGHFGQSAALFDQAAQLAAKLDNPSVKAMLLHYRGLDAWNRALEVRNHSAASAGNGVPDKDAVSEASVLEQANTLLAAADAAYVERIERLSPTALQTKTTQVATRNPFVVRYPPEVNRDQGLLANTEVSRDLKSLAEVRRARGLVLHALGRLDDSEAAIKSADDLSRGFGQPMESATLYRTGAMIAEARGDPQEASVRLSQSLSDYDRALPNTKAQAITYLISARNDMTAGKSDDAISACRIAVQILVRLNTGADPDQIGPCLDAYEAAARQHAGQADALRSEMFTAAQVAQSSITVAQIAQATARLRENTRDPKVAEAIRRYEDTTIKRAELYKQLDLQARAASSTGGAATPDSADLDRQIEATEREVADAYAALQVASPNYKQLVQQVVPAGDVLQLLQPDEALVSITLNRQAGWIFLLRNGHLVTAKIDGGLPRMADLVRRLRASIEYTNGSLPAFDTRSAQELYSATIGAAPDPLAGVRTLVVVPSGPLLAIPFEVLLTGPVDATNLAAAPWLVRKAAITHVPSPGNFVALRKLAGSSRATQTWFGLGEFQPVTLAQAERTYPAASCRDSARQLADLPKLRSAPLELQAARQMFGANANDELLGESFTVDRIRKTNLKDYRILQFAAHALLPAELRCQDEPTIITSAPVGANNASGALLTASAVTGLSLDAELVILSACNSGGGGGGSGGGESLSGLARAFFFAGARSLLTTHWVLDDRTGAYLVVDTLQRLHDKPAMGIAAALHDAQLALIDDAGKSSSADFAHPFFWAAFAVIGGGGGQPAGLGPQALLSGRFVSPR